MIFSKGKKQSKLTIKYFLRKEISPILFNENGHNDIYHHLYIEFIYKRKINKCKSQFYNFVNRDFNFYSFIWSFETSSLKGFNIYGVKDDTFSDKIKEQINGEDVLTYQKNNNDLLNLLILEKKHILALFSGLEQIESDQFSLSRLSDGYKNSIVFVLDIFDDILKNLVIERLIKDIPFFPKPDTTVEWMLFTTNIIKTVSLMDLKVLQNNGVQEMFNYIVLLGKFKVFFERYIVTQNNDGIRGITVPMWFSDNHQQKIRDEYSKKNLIAGLESKDDTAFYSILNIVEDKLEIEWQNIKNYFR